MRMHVLRVLLMATLWAVLPEPMVAADAPRIVHVFVALADNKNQGIVPVPAQLGDGEDARHNLYWGAQAGVKTFFARSSDWQLVHAGERPKKEILERCIFKHRRQAVYLIADAYRGIEIRQAIQDFLEAAAGTHEEKVTFSWNGQSLSLNAPGGSDLVAYVGHEGFMDFKFSVLPQGQASPRPQAIILACVSKTYFAAPMRAAGSFPLLWTTNLMAPEAYTLKSALDGWIGHETNEQVRTRAAESYNRYQKSGIRFARRLLVSGW